MSKAELKRERIIEAVAEHLLAHGLAGASLRPLAQAAGTSDRMLLYYFRDRDELIAAALAYVAGRLAMELSALSAPTPRPVDVLEQELTGIVLREAFWPFMRVWLDIASAAARGDGGAGEIGRQIALGFEAWIAARLDCAEPVERAAEARRILRAVEGAVVLQAVGLAPT
jgi:AcrR family transcriptional regulator